MGPGSPPAGMGHADSLFGIIKTRGTQSAYRVLRTIPLLSGDQGVCIPIKMVIPWYVSILATFVRELARPQPGAALLILDPRTSRQFCLLLPRHPRSFGPD